MTKVTKRPKNKPLAVASGKSALTDDTGPTRRNMLLLAFLVLILLDCISFYPSLRGEFTRWDDNQYVTENPGMKEFSFPYAADCFTRLELGNYHPLTMISLSMNYDSHNLNPLPFHVTNLLFHIFNTLIIFLLIRKLKFNDGVAFITAVFFGIQATRVESVAWISARKEVLSAFFALLSLFTYLYHCDKKEGNYYSISLLLFVLALLSKATSVMLAPILLVVDLWLNRLGKGQKVILEKIPFFILALAAGIVAIAAQQDIHALKSEAVLSLPERVVMALGNLLIYVQTLVIPYNLCAFYRYPLNHMGSLQAACYLFAFLFLGLAVILFYFNRKRWKEDPYIFGLLFFILGILPVLQIIPVGEASRADRYTYLPGMGIFLMLSVGILRLSQFKRAKALVYSTTAIALIASVIVSRGYARHWKSTSDLCESILRRDPKSATAYFLSGEIKHSRGETDEAMKSYNKAIENDSARISVAALNNRAILFTWKNQFSKAEKDLKLALSRDSSFAASYANLGFTLTRARRFEEGIFWLNKALSLKADDPMALGNRGYCFLQTGNAAQAKKDLDASLSLKYENPYAWYFMARYFLEVKDTASCCQALNNARSRGYSRQVGDEADSLYFILCK
jgi:Tfp pilus assembly protein PilF